MKNLKQKTVTTATTRDSKIHVIRAKQIVEQLPEWKKEAAKIIFHSSKINTK